jgi:hypothetical protein
MISDDKNLIGLTLPLPIKNVCENGGKFSRQWKKIKILSLFDCLKPACKLV